MREVNKMDYEEMEEMDFLDWWEMLDDIEREEYNMAMEELREKLEDE